MGTKKPRVLGQLDKMVDDGKLKQTVLNQAKLKRWKEIAYEKLSMWAYTTAIQFHKFSMPEIDISCEIIGKYGKGFKGPSAGTPFAASICKGEQET